MNVSHIYINLAAFLCFTLMFIAFFAAERSREMRAWLFLLGDMVLWSGGSVFMRLNVFPGYVVWYYVSLLALFSIAFLVYNYVYQFANVKNERERIIWFVGTIIMLIVSATGFFIAPPEASMGHGGKIVFHYTVQWRVVIPLVFLMLIIGSIVKLFRGIINSRGKKAPGVRELIIGCYLLVFGNILHVMPGSIFPWDALFGVVCAVMFILSLYKRRMFNTKPVISTSILVFVSAILCVSAAALSFENTVAFMKKYGGHFGSPDIEAFMLLTVIISASIAVFRKLLAAIFSDDERQGGRIKRYSDSVSLSLDIDSIVSQTVDVIRDTVRVDKMYICLLENGKYVPVYSTTPMDTVPFTIDANHPCVQYFEENDYESSHIVLHEFETDPLYKSVLGAERELLSKQGISCISALKDGSSVVGLLLLGEKEKGMGYTYADFSFLSTVLSIASIAIKNAGLYKQVAEREHLFSSMTAYIPNVILIKPKGEYRFCFVSANTERVLGLDASYFTSRTAHEVLSECVGSEDVGRVLDAMRNADSADSCYMTDIPFKTGDGRNIILRCAFSPIIYNGVMSHYVCVATDISHDIATQQLLMTSVELAQESNRAKGEFLSHMSHEIRTPMNSIAGLTYLAREMVAQGRDGELRDYLAQIDQASQYLLSLLNNIMDMSKIESSRYEISSAPFCITDVLDEMYSVFSAGMSSRGVEFTVNTQSLKYTNLMGDEISLRKILSNLLSNASKFTGSGGSVTLTVSEKTLSDKTVVVHFEVSDTGVGIGEDFISHLFEPYTQEMSSGGARAAGSGLGMAICKNMIDLLGGSIRVKSRVGEGTTFFVDIPYALTSATEKAPAALDLTALNGLHIMVVDDVAVNTVITCRLLERHGAIVDCAENGREAAELFYSNDDGYYDCILMDIQMPVMDGVRAAAAIRSCSKSYGQTVPIVAMTADAFINVHGGNLSDFNDYIIKPVKPDELYAKLINNLK